MPMSLKSIRDALFALQTHLAWHAARAGEEEAERLREAGDMLDTAEDRVERVLTKPVRREAASLGESQLALTY